ncbi:MAG: Long-chain-fatty-acid--CoA ligase [uncultured Thermomicrobiales bacterium]|uniref:Long-chain-fatty-acid--CoA ligase n=1 Tax=uncultured Thermomicrobiales bacterium TaxID=1645740 RepID=A0A6J4VBK6_9BACT|nr:MAG: Long-chain-fatty-acid--CoA ligase [uncultured Thermomicrobiales bacterium]
MATEQRIQGDTGAADRPSRVTVGARPWLGQYEPGAPAQLHYPDQTLPELLADAVARYADLPAIAYFGGTLSYRELDRLSAQFANRLLAFGLQKGDRVLVILPNVPQFLIAHFGILRAGGIDAAISPLLVEREIEQLVRDAGAKIVVVLDTFYPKVAGLLTRGTVERIIVASPDEYLPIYQRLFYPLKAEGKKPEVPDAPRHRLYRFRRLLRGAPTDVPRVALSPDDVATFQYTGGTTGLPKAAMLTHRNLIANVVQIKGWVPSLRAGEEVLLSIMPFFHAYGTTLCLHLAILMGAKQVIMPRFNVQEVLAAIRKHRPTVFPGVPMMYVAICSAVREDSAKAAGLSSIRYCVSGAASLPVEVREEFERLTGAHLAEGYGLSEAAPVTHLNPLDGRARSGKIGLPVADVEICLADPATGEPLAGGGQVGVAGELLIRGPQIMKGYWQRPEESAEILRDGWLHTGDIATMDEDGFFAIVDRKKDVIITSGENIYPREIEEVLYGHPQIQEAVVLGVAHEVVGQAVKAYIVPRAGETLTRRDILTYCGERLAKYKVPRQIEFRESLPKTLTGKILRRVLLEEEAARPKRRRRGGEGAGEGVEGTV